MMKNIYKAVAAVCAMAALMSSVPALPVSADTITKPMYYAQADMGAATDFNRVNIDFGGSAPDEYPRHIPSLCLNRIFGLLFLVSALCRQGKFLRITNHSILVRHCARNVTSPSFNFSPA